MGSQLIQLQENVWVIQGGANIGIIASAGRCLVIDSGMDKDAGRDILNQLKKLNLTPTSLLVTRTPITSGERTTSCVRPASKSMRHV